MEKQELDKMINELCNLFCQVINENDLQYKPDTYYAIEWNNILDKYNYESRE